MKNILYKIAILLVLINTSTYSYSQIIAEPTDCESYVAIVLDESGSISTSEAEQIKKGLHEFIDSELESGMTISMIGMSNGDTNKRTDAYLEQKVTASTQPIFHKWIDQYRVRSGDGISAQSDYWASGFQVVLEDLRTTPDIVIVVTDGSQVNKVDLLKSRMEAINATSHLYVYGIEQGSYINNRLPSSSLFNTKDDPNVISEKDSKDTIRAAGGLKESLALLLEREPISSQSDLLNSDYYAYDSFEVLQEGLANLSNDLVSSGVGCENCTDKNPTSEFVKSLFVDVLRYVIVKLQSGATANDLNGTLPAELTALAPYITDTGRIGLHSFFIRENEGFSFSFISHGRNDYRNPDVYFIPTNTINSIDTTVFNPNLDLSSYVNPYSAVSLYSIPTHIGGKKDIKLLQFKHIDFCPEEPVKIENSFCTSQMGEDNYPTVADLIPSGNTIQWYLSATGGLPIALGQELVEESEDPTGAVYWWDDITDGITIRTAITAYVNLGVLDAETYDYQEFSEALNATIGNLQPSGSGITWYNTPVGGSPLNTSIPLINGAIYYVQETGGSSCRLAVEVFIGTKPPTGNGIQYACEGQTIADIQIETQDNVSTILWYTLETGGTPISTATLLTNNTTYYAAQVDGFGDESIERYPVTIILMPVTAPIVPFSTQSFYNNPLDPPTIADLLAIGFGIQWYANPTGGVAYDPLELVVDGQTYYAEQNIGICPSERIPLIVDILDQTGPDLLGCEKFKPQFGDRYVINAWVREQAVVPVNPEVKQFNNSIYSDLFVDLLTHLKELTISDDPALHDIPKEYIPTSTTENLDFDPLLPFVKNTTVQERKLIVYDFTRLIDDYGRTIGFEFWLNSDRTSKVVYQSPLVTGKNYRYPLIDNVAYQTVNFKDAYTQSGQLIIKSDFVSTGTPIQSNINTTYANVVSAIESQVTFYDYEEVVGYQPMDYVNTLVQLEYKDVDRNVISVDEEYIKFTPQGEIIDGWQRIAADFIIPLNAAQMTIGLVNNSDNLAYFDDIRMHPHNSNMKTFVYDPITQRLMSELDENNYATFYEYDAEGGLVRVKKETEKGIYTIQETRSGTTKTQ